MNKEIGKLTDAESIANAVKFIAPLNISPDNIIFACIGTDRITGDALGPLVGTSLQKMGYDVMGTIMFPLHAANLEERIVMIPKDKLVIAIDSSLGEINRVNTVTVKEGCIRPGAGVGKRLSTVGDIAICGFVNIDSDNTVQNRMSLSTTRLSSVMQLADNITEAISIALPLKTKNHYNEIAVSKFL